MSYQIDSSMPSRQIHLFSQTGQQLTSDLNSDLYFNFNEELASVPPSVDIIFSVVSATIPYSWLNVSGYLPLLNNQFIYTIVENLLFPRLITVPDGYYNIIELLNYLNDTPQFIQDGIIASYDRPTSTVTLTRATIFTILSASSLASLLGYELGVIGMTGYNLSSTKPINLMRTQSIYVTSDLPTETFDSRIRGRSSVLCRIPVRGTPGSYIVWENITGFKTRLHDKVVNNRIHIRLTDDDGNDLTLRDYPWTLTIQLDFVNVLPDVVQTRLEMGADFSFGNRNEIG